MPMNRHGTVTWGIAAVLAGAVLVVVTVSPIGSDPTDPRKPATAPTASPHHPVTIVGAGPAPGIPTGEVDRLGNPVLANCTTCHTKRAPNLAIRDGAQLTEFHQGLTMSHGQLQCVACHNPNNYTQLRLAGGETLEFSESMRLCAQCHGPQFRDYQHGAHGGMTGYWDLSQGPRSRNHCLACHDPHAPKYQRVMPVFPPRDLPQGHQPPHGAHQE